MELKEAASDVFIQWKGTDVCLDFHCYKCNTFGHVDADFVYFIQCPTCRQVYQMPDVFALKPVGPDPSRGLLTEADGPSQDLAECGWTTPTPLGQCNYPNEWRQSDGR